MVNSEWRIVFLAMLMHCQPKFRSAGARPSSQKLPNAEQIRRLKISSINHWLKPVAWMVFVLPKSTFLSGFGSICSEQDHAHPAINGQRYPVDIVGAGGKEYGRLPQILVNSQTVRRRCVQEALKPFRFPL